MSIHRIRVKNHHVIFVQRIRLLKFIDHNKDLFLCGSGNFLRGMPTVFFFCLFLNRLRLWSIEMKTVVFIIISTTRICGTQCCRVDKRFLFFFQQFAAILSLSHYRNSVLSDMICLRFS